MSTAYGLILEIIACTKEGKKIKLNIKNSIVFLDHMKKLGIKVGENND